jgi:hypothetical protein
MRLKSSNRKLFVVLCLICTALMVPALFGFSCSCDKKAAPPEQGDEVEITLETILREAEAAMNAVQKEFVEWGEGAQGFLDEMGEYCTYGYDTGAQPPLLEVRSPNIYENLISTKQDYYAISGEDVIDSVPEDYKSLAETRIEQIDAFKAIFLSTDEFIAYTLGFLSDPNFCPVTWNEEYQGFMTELEEPTRVASELTDDAVMMKEACDVDWRAADISITKSITDPEDGVVLPGDTVTYHFKVENTGTEDLFNVMVNDPLFNEDCEVTSAEGEPLSSENGEGWYLVHDRPLDRGLEWDFYVKYVVPETSPVPVANTARVFAERHNGQPVFDRYSCSTRCRDSGIYLYKTGSPKEAVAGDTITYTFQVINIGRQNLVNTKVEDRTLGITHVFGDLPAGEASEPFTWPYEVQPDDTSPLENFAVADGTNEEGHIHFDAGACEVLIRD